MILPNDDRYARDSDADREFLDDPIPKASTTPTVTIKPSAGNSRHGGPYKPDKLFSKIIKPPTDYGSEEDKPVVELDIVDPTKLSRLEYTSSSTFRKPAKSAKSATPTKPALDFMYEYDTTALYIIGQI